MAEKRKLAFYIRLSDADEEVKEGTKDESNSITGQRKLLYPPESNPNCVAICSWVEVLSGQM